MTYKCCGCDEEGFFNIISMLLKPEELIINLCDCCSSNCALNLKKGKQVKPNKPKKKNLTQILKKVKYLDFSLKQINSPVKLLPCLRIGCQFCGPAAVQKRAIVG